MWQKFKCWIGFHKDINHDLVGHPYPWETWVITYECERCGKKMRVVV